MSNYTKQYEDLKKKYQFLKKQHAEIEDENRNLQFKLMETTGDTEALSISDDDIFKIDDFGNMEDDDLDPIETDDFIQEPIKNKKIPSNKILGNTKNIYFQSVLHPPNTLEHIIKNKNLSESKFINKQFPIHYIKNKKIE